MYESMQNNANTHIGDDLERGQRSGEQASCHMPPNLGKMPPIFPELANNIGNPNYCPALVAELMKGIPQVPTETPSKDDKLTDRITRRNLKVYDRNYDPVVLDEWVRGMEKTFTVVEIPEEKKVSIGTYYLTGEANIWCNNVKGRLIGPEFTRSKFLEELSATFYRVVV